jgi:hypothetical protein
MTQLNGHSSLIKSVRVVVMLSVCKSLRKNMWILVFSDNFAQEILTPLNLFHLLAVQGNHNCLG